MALAHRDLAGLERFVLGKRERENPVTEFGYDLLDIDCGVVTQGQLEGGVATFPVQRRPRRRRFLDSPTDDGQFAVVGADLKTVFGDARKLDGYVEGVIRFPNAIGRTNRLDGGGVGFGRVAGARRAVATRREE